MRSIAMQLTVAVIGLLAISACSSDSPVSPTDRVRRVELAALDADTLLVGDTVELSAATLDANDASVAGAVLSWSTSAPSVVAIDSLGVVRAVGVGRAVLRVSSGLGADSVSVLVARLVIRPSVDSLLVGDTLRIYAVAVGPNSEFPVARPVEFAATASDVARVDSSGLVFGLGHGQSSVVVRSGGAADTVQLAVFLTRIPVPAALVAVTAGAAQVCGLTATGEAYCWGAHLAQAGAVFGDPLWKTDPQRVLTDARFTRLDAGIGGTCGWATDLAMYCWGRNDYSNVAPDTNAGAWIQQPRRIRTDLSFVTGMISQRGQACGITAADEPYCWGYNTWGTLGRTTAASRDTAIARVGGDLRLTMLDSDGYDACGVDPAGSVWCWGEHAAALAGSPELARTVPRRLSTSFRFSSVVLGLYMVCGITESGDAACWGPNDRGNLGLGFKSDFVEAPSTVVGGHKWKQLAAGFFTCGITTNDKLFCWGAPAGFRERDVTRPQAVAPTLSFRHVAVTYWGGDAWGWACAVTLGGETYCFIADR